MLTTAFSQHQIENRVRELGSEISRDYAQSGLHAIGILDDAFMFMADLVRASSCPIEIDFLKMERRDTVSRTHPLRDIVYDPITDIAGKDVLLIDAIVDTGITLDHLIQQMLLKKANSVRTAVLIDRESSRKLDLRVNYAGFEWDGGYLVGYGLDRNGLYRSLPYLATLASDEAGGIAIGAAAREAQ